MTTAPTNEILALADKLSKMDIHQFRSDELSEREMQLLMQALRLSATTSARDMREALPSGIYYSLEHDNFYEAATSGGCGNSFYEAWKDRWREFPQSKEAVLSNLDAAAPAAGIPTGWKLVPIEPAQAMVHAGYKGQPDAINFGAAQCYRDMIEVAPKPPALQAPSHSDAVREALKRLIRSICNLRVPHEVAAQIKIIVQPEIDNAAAALNAPAAKVPAVSEADVGPIGFEAGFISLIKDAIELLAERQYGNPARSPGHNARLTLESALSLYAITPAKSATPTPPSADVEIGAVSGDGSPETIKFDGRWFDRRETVDTLTSLLAEARAANWHGADGVLEVIAKRLEAWDTTDIWRSDAAGLVRSYKQSAAHGGGTEERVDEPKFGCKRAGGFVDSNCMAACDYHRTMRLDRPSDPPSQEASEPKGGGA